MIDDVRLELHRAVLADLRGSKPKSLNRALEYQAQDMTAEAGELANEADFSQTMDKAQSTDSLVEAWRRQLTDWDYRDTPDWSTADKRTDARREDVYEALSLSQKTRRRLTELVPVPKGSGPVVIAEKNRAWYPPIDLSDHEWYWPYYRDLLVKKGWPSEAVSGIDEASTRIVEHLADPARAEAYQAKGLVVGYVQSGKTANFTGVIAKAIDAGYRLVIVLGGTLNLLREQTQRRLDMELVGRENILRGTNEIDSDYADDPAWIKGEFQSFGEMPSILKRFDIIRLTTRAKDYQSLRQGIIALESEKVEPALPLYDPKNLYRSSARLMVVKKNSTVLAKLLKDLDSITTPLAEIPVLIIDDESDEASLNTVDLGKPNAERTAINRKISRLLKMLPRAQYVGYTATPFANVFVDPSDTEDIFPKDFIVSLPRPFGYMGASDFHDLDVAFDGKKNYANSNERAHVRNIAGSDDEDTYLRRAVDTFVLAAAIKMYRQQEGGLGDGFFQHHTMLIHESGWQIDHRELLARVSKLWFDSGYTGTRGHARLRELFESDVQPVSQVRSDGYAVPSSYEQLMPHVGPAAMRIGGDQKPIIVVNGDKDIETGEADFAKRSIWKILIGGQKLSRGFTVEGLTVTYFRRRAGNASVLMQMGRWFGFRDGYRDLVRLYIGRQETVGKKEIDLYEAFEAVCNDENSFRSELAQYSRLIDGVPQITPAQVPPLVSQHLSWLKPVSPNKMYNARLVEIATPGVWKEPTAYPTAAADLKHNYRLWEPVFDSLSTVPETYKLTVGRAKYELKALRADISADDLLAILDDLKWVSPIQFAPYLTYLTRITKSRQVDDWMVFAPQLLGSDAASETTGSAKLAMLSDDRLFSWFARDRRRGPLFGAISDPKHRPVPTFFAGAIEGRMTVGEADPHIETNRHLGALVLYPIVESTHREELKANGGKLDSGKVVIGFGYVAPSSAHSLDDRVIRFTTFDSSKADLPIIDQGK